MAKINILPLVLATGGCGDNQEVYEREVKKMLDSGGGLALYYEEPTG